MLLALLVLPGILIRAAVPPGFMPAMSHGLTLTMAMCSGHAAPSLIVQQHGGAAPTEPRQPTSPQHEAPCVFAATAGGAPPPLVATVAAAPTLQDDHVLPSFAALHVRPTARAHAPRAPPPLV